MARDRFAVIVHTLIQNEAGETLLLRRANTGFMDGYYSLPGGHRETGESVSRCAIRECFEEAGVVVDEVRPAMVLPYGDGVNFLFIASAWHGEPVIGEPDKCDGLLFAQAKALPEPAVGWLADAFKSMANGVWYAEFD